MRAHAYAWRVRACHRVYSSLYLAALCIIVSHCTRHPYNARMVAFLFKDATVWHP